MFPLPQRHDDVPYLACIRCGYRCEDATELCDYCDEYHENLVNCPHMDPTRPLRRTTDLEEEEMDRAAYARHDRRLFG
jgi:hypothetical protein